MSTAVTRRFGGYALGVLVFLFALGVWELWAGAANSVFVPTASEVAERAWDIWPTSDFLSQVAQSMKRYVVGFAIAAAIGIALGLLVGASHAVRRTLDPLLECLRAVPAIAIVPAAIFIFDFGDASRIVVIAFGLCFPILVNTADGVRGIPLEVRDTASMLHVGWAERLARIYLPAALPSIMAGLRFAVSLGLVLVVVSEFKGEANGLGYYLVIQESLLDYPALYAGILFLGLLGYVLNRLFLVAEHRLLAWHYGAAGE